MLPLLPLLGYFTDIQRVMRGSIAKNATPLLPQCYPLKFSQTHTKLFYRFISHSGNWEFTGRFLGV